MFRMTLLLCVGIYLTMLIAGYRSDMARTAAASLPVAPEPVRAAAPEPAAPVLPAPAFAPASAPVLTLARLEPEPEPVTLSIAEAVEPEPAPAAEAEPEFPVRYVSARRVNVRQGPSTGHAVVGQLVLGEAALVVSAEGGEWVRIRIEGDGIEGFVAARFLQDDLPSQ